MTITVSRAARWRSRSRAILSAAAVVALMGVALALPTQVAPPQPVFSDIPTVDIDPGDTRLVCPGAVQLTTALGSDDVSYDLDLDTGAEQVETQTLLASAHPLPETAEVGEPGNLTTRTEPVVQTDAGASPIVATFTPEGDAAPSVAGVTAGMAEEGDLRGMVAGSCNPASSSMWLVGGNTEVGSSTQLILTNPGETPARTKVQGWTGIGPMASEVVELIEPGESKVVLTETMDRAERLAFHVSTEGGQVSAYLSTSTLDGIVPHGVSYVTPGAPPALETFVGPVHVEAFDTQEWQTELRIVNPGEEPANVSVALLGENGEEPLGGADDLTIDPGVVTDVPVAAPEAGTYTLRVTSDAPVASSTRTVAESEPSEEIGGTPLDMSWLPSGHLSENAMILTSFDPALAVTNPAPDTAEVEVEGIDDAGEIISTQHLTLEPLQTAEIDAPEEAVAVRFSGAYILATAQYRQGEDESLIAAVPATWAGRGGTSVSVVVDN